MRGDDDLEPSRLDFDELHPISHGHNAAPEASQEGTRWTATMGGLNSCGLRIVIDARLLRWLDLSGSPDESSAPHLSAASGVVRVGQRLFVVADDEHSLGVFDLAVDGPGRRVRLFDGELPSDHQQRKSEKPDLEALTSLPPLPDYPFGALLGVGSGSKPSRQCAVLLRLDEYGAIDGEAAHLDLAPLYEPLRLRFGDLNIEGLFISGGALCLLQRGNRKTRVNACVAFDWHEVARWIQGASARPTVQRIEEFDLGTIDDVPLCFTDGAALPGVGWVFCAAAEDTTDSCADGRCVGSAVGIVDGGGRLVRMERLAGAFKAEGIVVSSDGEPLELLLVTDADDRRVAAQLLSVRLPRKG